MISAIFDAIMMVLGLILDIVTLPFRIVFARLGGADLEFLASAAGTVGSRDSA